jgi:hypothetical protein
MAEMSSANETISCQTTADRQLVCIPHDAALTHRVPVTFVHRVFNFFERSGLLSAIADVEQQRFQFN